MRALLVIDLQEIYVGKERNQKIFNYPVKEMMAHINERIQEFDSDKVFYIQNVFPDRWLYKVLPIAAVKGSVEAELADELLVVSNEVYFKNKGDAFTNTELSKRLKAMNIEEVEVIGVDGGGCVSLTALGAIQNGFKVVMNAKCIGTTFQKKADKFKIKLLKQGAVFI